MQVAGRRIRTEPVTSAISTTTYARTCTLCKDVPGDCLSLGYTLVPLGKPGSRKPPNLGNCAGGWRCLGGLATGR